GRPAFGNITFRELTALARSGGFVTRPASEVDESERHMFHITDDNTVSVLNGASTTGSGVVVVATSDVVQRRRATDPT
ncbi:MAG: hypothetical protein ACR2P0_14685, partial [Acidimicrobiales bacterium]